jgi:hypothetical protein
MQSAVFVMHVPGAAKEVSVVWQSKQLIPACGPAESWKQASCPANRAPLKRVGKWQLLQSVPKPARK